MALCVIQRFQHTRIQFSSVTLSGNSPQCLVCSMPRNGMVVFSCHSTLPRLASSDAHFWASSRARSVLWTTVDSLSSPHAPQCVRSEMFSVRVPVRKLVKQPAVSHPLSHLHPSTSKFFFLISPTKHSLEQNRQLTIASPLAQSPHVLAPDISHLFVTASLVSTHRARTPTALLPRPPPPSCPPPSDDRTARPHARAASWRCSASRAHEVKTDWERKGCPHGRGDAYV